MTARLKLELMFLALEIEAFAFCQNVRNWKFQNDLGSKPASYNPVFSKVQSSHCKKNEVFH